MNTQDVYRRYKEGDEGRGRGRFAGTRSIRGMKCRKTMENDRRVARCRMESKDNRER
jgi:hypothetical protein